MMTLYGYWPREDVDPIDRLCFAAVEGCDPVYTDRIGNLRYEADHRDVLITVPEYLPPPAGFKTVLDWSPGVVVGGAKFEPLRPLFTRSGIPHFGGRHLTVAFLGEGGKIHVWRAVVRRTGARSAELDQTEVWSGRPEEVADEAPFIAMAAALAAQEGTNAPQYLVEEARRAA